MKKGRVTYYTEQYITAASQRMEFIIPGKRITAVTDSSSALQEEKLKD